MSDISKQPTIYFESDLHQALRLKAAYTHCSVSEIVYDAVRQSLREDQDNLAGFEQRTTEPTLSYEDFFNGLKVHGKL